MPPTLASSLPANFLKHQRQQERPDQPAESRVCTCAFMCVCTHARVCVRACVRVCFRLRPVSGWSWSASDARPAGDSEGQGEGGGARGRYQVLVLNRDPGTHRHTVRGREGKHKTAR